MVGQSFLLAGSSLPNIDGLASSAIWANYWVGNDSGDLPPPQASLPPLLISPPCSELECLGLLALGVHWHWGFLCLCMDMGLCFHLLAPPLFPILWHHFCSGHAGI